MPYITNPNDISSQIAAYTQAKTLWVDTEVADYNTKKPRLSLIQVLDESTDLSGDRVLMLDILEYPDIAEIFIDKIMLNPAIEKVFHNASFDLKLLGKNKAKNVICTLEIAKKIPYYLLPVPNLQLKTLAENLCYFPNVDKTQSQSDWGQRPLTKSQLHYAKMDPVYLAHVHHRLLQLTQLINPNPANEDLTALAQRYREIEHNWKSLDTEINHLKDRIKAAMLAQNLAESDYFKLSSYEKTTKKVSFDELAKFAHDRGINLDFSITLTQNLQKQLGLTDGLPIQEEKSITSRLNFKEKEQDEADDDIPF